MSPLNPHPDFWRLSHLERTCAGETDHVGWFLAAGHAVEVYTAEGHAVVTGIDPEDVHSRLAVWGGLSGVGHRRGGDRGWGSRDCHRSPAERTIAFSLTVVGRSAEPLAQLDWVEVADGARWIAVPTGQDGPAEPLNPELPIDVVQAALDRIGAGVDL